MSQLRLSGSSTASALFVVVLLFLVGCSAQQVGMPEPEPPATAEQSTASETMVEVQTTTNGQAAVTVPSKTVTIVATLPPPSPTGAGMDSGSQQQASEIDTSGKIGASNSGLLGLGSTNGTSQGAGAPGLGSISIVGSGQGGRGYGAGAGSGPKGSGSTLLGGKARWEIAPFKSDANWLAEFPQLATDEIDYGSRLSHLVKRLLRRRLVNATASDQKLTPERLEELVEEGVKYLCDGTIKNLSTEASNGELELHTVYRLRRVIGNNKFRLVQIRPLTARTVLGSAELQTALNGLLLKTARQIADALLRDMPADMNAIRG